MLWCGVRVGREVTDALELQVGERLHRGSIRLNIALLDDVQRVRVDHLLHGSHCVAVLCLTDGSQLIAGILHLPQTVVEAHLGLHGMGTTHPVEGLALDLAVRTRQTAARLWVVGAVDGGYIAILVLVAGMVLIALYNVCVL